MAYVPDVTGRYTILIKYGGDEIPFSPYRVRAVPTGDASKCTVTGEPSVPAATALSTGLGCACVQGLAAWGGVWEWGPPP